MKALATISTVALTALLAACGGSDNSSSSSSSQVSSVKVAGASLSDSGTFGYKFTVQSADSKVYSERVAAAYGMTSFCHTYTYTGSAFTNNAGCTNYAVAGAKVNNFNTTAGAVVESIPLSIIKQLQDLGTAGFSASDLLIVGEASSNDAAALATAYLTDLAIYKATGSTAGATNFATLVGTLGVSGTFATELTKLAGKSTTTGADYMVALADKLVAAIETNALANGAQRVAIVNTLDVTKTPKFQAVLSSLGSSAPAVQALVQAWVTAYNTELAAKVAASTYASKMVVVDLRKGFDDEIAAPAAFGLNVDTSSTICDDIVNATGTKTPGATGLDTPSVVAACTATAATALNLTGGWQTYLFADSFHPTPYGHELLSLVFFQTLGAKGWHG